MSEIILAALRHDAHKFTGESHQHAPETFEGVPVNQTVPYGADSDAAALSRPSDEPVQTVATHATQARLSLLTGSRRDDRNDVTGDRNQRAVHELLTETDPEGAHERWLDSEVAAAFNESVYYPYTSLKYHTLLVTALVSHYETGTAFEELFLVVDPARTVVPFRTVFAGQQFSLRLGTKPGCKPSACLGRHPRRSWAGVWSRLSEHPLETDSEKWQMVLDANLRRIRAWSTALQYIEDFEAWRVSQ